MKHSNLPLSAVQKLARDIAKKVVKTGGVIGLSGNLGSGKTTFTKAFAKQLGIKRIKSPTFIVSQRHPLKNKFLYHLDFYRLDRPKQLAPLGLSEILKPLNIVVIEWIEKFPSIKRKCDILINLKVTEKDHRDVNVKFPKNK